MRKKEEMMESPMHHHKMIKHHLKKLHAMAKEKGESKMEEKREDRMEDRKKSKKSRS